MTYKISKDEIQQFALLLEKGLDTKTMIDLCFKDSDKIIDQLNRGQQLKHILCAHNKSIYFQLIESLSSYMSFSKSIFCANEIDQHLSEFFKKVIKRTAYPIFIFCFSYFMILFFSNSIVPQMMSFSKHENSFIILEILKIVFTVVFVLFIMMILILIICICFKQFRIYCLNRFEKIKMFRIYQSIQFSLVFEVLLKSGLSTKVCFEALSKMNFYTTINRLSNQILDRLNKGEKIDLIIGSTAFDSTFTKFFKIGIKTGSLDKVLNLYQKQATIIFEKNMNRIISGIQIGSYLSVGMLVLVVYQIMLVPLNMLNTM